MLDNRKDGDRVEAMAREHAGGVGAAVAATLSAKRRPMLRSIMRQSFEAALLRVAGLRA